MTDTPLGPGPEFDRIRAIATALGGAGAGLGDDCAFLPDGWCVSTDLSVDGVHFRREWLTPAEIGWRATSAALSDLAAVGASADAVLVGLAAPGDLSAAFLAEVMAGAGRAAESVGAQVVGGDLTGGSAFTVAVTVMGRAERPVRRAGCRPGDGLWVTGALGGARAALAAWAGGGQPSPPLRSRFAAPQPRVAAGRWLAAHGATAMIDLSDGLGGDVRHLAAASGVGVIINLDQLPVDPAIDGDLHLGMALPLFAAAGGEDYELLASLPVSVGGPLVADGVPLTCIGSATADQGVIFRLAGREVSVAGFDHFA